MSLSDLLPSAKGFNRDIPEAELERKGVKKRPFTSLHDKEIAGFLFRGRGLAKDAEKLVEIVKEVRQSRC